MRVKVVDNGIGVKKSDHSKLFKMFGKLKRTSKQNDDGIGLGLTISKEIVEHYNGRI